MGPDTILGWVALVLFVMAILAVILFLSLFVGVSSVTPSHTPLAIILGTILI